MNEKDINKRIRKAFDSVVPDSLDSILSDCKNQKGLILTMTETKKKNKWARYFAGMAACLVLAVGCFFGYRVYDMNYAVASTVSLDVNPSIQITVNKKEHVLDVTPLNEDGKTVIGEMDFSGSSIDITVNALIGSMLRCGYISELANSILISVDNGTSDSSLQDRLTAEVSALLQTDSFTGAVLSQTVTGDSALRQIAEEYGITVGKAQLISKILMLDGMKTFEELASLSINELNLIVKSYTDALDNVSSVGQASDKAYIGEDKAKEIVLTHASLTQDRISRYKAEMDMENGILVYEIEFCSGDYEYEYGVDALTGNIIKHEKELDDGTHINNGDHQGQQDETTLISVEQAKELVLSHAGISTSDIIFVKIDFDDEDGIKHYEIEFVSGGYEYDYDINALTGAVIKCEKELDDDDRTDEEQQDSRLISAEEAKSAALTHAGISASETLFITAELDIDNGLKCYEVEFASGDYEYDYDIDAHTGAVIKHEKKLDDDHQTNAGQQTGTAVISAAKAKELALSHAGLKASQVVFEKAKLDYEDGVKYYDVEFSCNGYEYEYEIDACTGAVLNAEKDLD